MSDNGTGLATIYSVPPNNSSVTKVGILRERPARHRRGDVEPDGTGVQLASGGFNLKNGSPAIFLFASEDGAISGWNPALGFGPGAAIGLIAVDNGNPDPSKNAVYKGLAIRKRRRHAVRDEFPCRARSKMYDSSFAISSGTSWTRRLPAGYAPFDAKVINGKLYVTFAKQNAAKHDDVAGLGNGFVDVFNLDGSGRTKRLISGGALELAVGPGDCAVGVRGRSAAIFWSEISATGGSTPMIQPPARSRAPRRDQRQSACRSTVFGA